MSILSGRSRADIVRLAAALLAVSILAGCAGPGITAPANTLALSPAPASSSTPSLSPSPSPSPSPDQIAQAAQAYNALATKHNAEIAALGRLSSTPTLAQIKAFYKRLAEMEADGVAAIQAISFPTRLRDDAENLIRAANALQKVQASIAASTSLAQVYARSEDLALAFDAMGLAVDNLRGDLGLPPRVASGPSPTLKPTASRSPSPRPASSTDPTADLRIGPPFELQPTDGAEMAQFEAGLKAGLGSLTMSYRVGARWAAQGDERVALVLVLQLPGIGAELSLPAFVDQMAASTAGVSTADVITTWILGQSLRFVEKLGVPIAVYVHGEGVAIVIGLPGMTFDSLGEIVTVLITVRP